jgi:hypothetical protein
MFPFLSVLCTVIGVLVLFIVLVLSTRVVVEDERYQRTVEYDRKARAGRQNVVDQGIDEEAHQVFEAELRRLRDVLAERQAERRELAQELAALEVLLEEKKTDLLLPRPTIVRPREFDKPLAVNVVPARGYQVKLDPILVEVSSQGYTIHPSHPLPEPFPPVQVKEDSDKPYVATPELAKYLREVDRCRKEEYLVFLIHPNGVAAFDAIRGYLIEKHEKIRVGWEPFSRDWVMASDTD